MLPLTLEAGGGARIMTGFTWHGNTSINLNGRISNIAHKLAYDATAARLPGSVLEFDWLRAVDSQSERAFVRRFECRGNDQIASLF